MKIISSIEKFSYDVGKDIGHSDNLIQGRLLNGFAHAFESMQDRDKEMQLCYISDELDNFTKELIISLAEFCKEAKHHE